ncbi:MAG: oligoribonuclease [Gammaproteobacteria bacterium]|nr:oligoribonuclease [Gammaproteobacteria bacterium]
MSVNAKNLVWLDCEMTGLTPEKNRIIEIATVVTDSHLTILAEGPALAIYQPEDHLQSMDSWNQKHHRESGLLDRVRASSTTESEAETKTLEFLKQYVPAGKSPLCGNTVHQDRSFLRVYMPTLERFFHYRNLDVSTVKTLAERWAHYLVGGIKKKSKHLAQEDIRDSIEELRYYRECFFNFVRQPK